MAANRYELKIYFNFCNFLELDGLFIKFRDLLINNKDRSDQVDQIF